MRVASGYVCKCVSWGGDSYVTGDGDDSAENGVLAGGVVRGWLTSEAR